MAPMFKLFRNAWDIVSAGQWLYGILTVLFPSAAAIFTMISAYLSDLAWYQVLFWGSGTFCFFIVSFSHINQNILRLTVFERVHFLSAGIKQFRVSTQEIGKEPTHMIILQVSIANYSDTQVFIQPTRIDQSIDGRVNPRAKLETPTYVIEPRADIRYTLAAVPELVLKPQMTGSIEIEALYGQRRDRLKYRFHYKGALSISTRIGDDPNKIDADVICRNITMEHSRI